MCAQDSVDPVCNTGHMVAACFHNLVMFTTKVRIYAWIAKSISKTMYKACTVLQ